MESTDDATQPTPTDARPSRGKSRFLKTVVPLALLTVGVVAGVEWWTGMWNPELFGVQRELISSQRNGGDGASPKSKSAAKKADRPKDDAKTDRPEGESPHGPGPGQEQEK